MPTTSSLIQFILDELFRPQGRRETDKANRWPDVEAGPDGVSAKAATTIVEDLLEARGYTKAKQTQTCSVWSRLLEDGTLERVRLRFEPQADDVLGTDGGFNPFEDILVDEAQPIDNRFITGFPTGAA